MTKSLGLFEGNEMPDGTLAFVPVEPGDLVIGIEREDELVSFSQRDDRWARERYSPTGAGLFGQYGCLVTALASLATFAGYEVTPLTFARAIGDQGVFVGNFLNHPSRVVRAFPKLRWHVDKFFKGHSSFVNWRHQPADLTLLRSILHRQPVIAEVDFDEVTPAMDQHFVLALAYEPDPAGGIDDRLMIMDPWTGQRENVLVGYFNPRWMRDGSMNTGQTKVSRTLTGLRVWEVVGAWG